MKSLKELCLQPNLVVEDVGIDGGCGSIQFGHKKAVVIWSFGGGWEHVSISFKYRCPTWEEMCQVKDMFFREDECVVQYHPAKSEYVNRHPYCLHLWRPLIKDMPTPPTQFVG